MFMLKTSVIFVWFGNPASFEICDDLY